MMQSSQSNKTDQLIVAVKNYFYTKKYSEYHCYKTNSLDYNFESDFLSITQKDMIHEVEIVLPNKKKQGLPETEFNFSNKLKRLSDGKGPNYYWFLSLDGVLKEDMIPEFAGLLIAKQEKSGFVISEKKEAPKIHNEKCNDQRKLWVIGVMMNKAWKQFEDSVSGASK